MFCKNSFEEEKSMLQKEFSVEKFMMVQAKCHLIILQQTNRFEYFSITLSVRSNNKVDESVLKIAHISAANNS